MSTQRSAQRQPLVAFSLVAATLVALSQVAGAVPAPSDAPTRVTFSVLSACDWTGTPVFTASIGGTLVGTISTGACGCEAKPQTLVVEDPAVLALVGQPLCTGVTVALSGGTTQLSWVSAEITRATGTETLCLADPGSSSCTSVTFCEGYAEAAPATWSATVDDLDVDGVDNCTDPDLDGDGILNEADTCPIVADPSNADSNGDGRGDACSPQPLNVVTVPWLGDRAQAHEVYPGGRIVLQGVAVQANSDLPTEVATATWDPGDGSGPVAVDTTNPLALELFHTYQGTPGQRYTATLTVTDATGATDSDTFPVVVKARTLDVEINMAVDTGLWAMHKQLHRRTLEGLPVASMTGGYDLPGTASAVLALAMHHHVATGDASLNPYVHNVNRMLQWLETQLTPWQITNKAAGNPDANGNGIALSSFLGGQPNYITGHILTAFIATETPDRVAVLGPEGVRGRPYRDIAQDMVDYASWGQMDSNFAFPERGSWNYSQSPGHADNSVSQWVAGGLIAAEKVWGLTIPPFVKADNNQAVRETWNVTGSVGYMSTEPIWSEGAGTTPSGVVQWTMDGRPNNNPELRQSLLWLAGYHRTRNNYHASRDPYVLYATSRAYRLLRDASGAPAPLHMVDDNPGDAVPAWDWFRNDPAVGAPSAAGPVGMARAIIGSQNAQGGFMMPGYVDLQSLKQPWSLLVLASTVFERGPRAVCTAQPSPSTGPVTFSAVDSFHPVTGRTILDYTWDLGDGTTASGLQVFHTYTLPPEETATRTATLRVRDDRGNTHTTSCVVTIDTTNAAPIAGDQQYTTPEDTALTGNVLSTASDADGDPLTASVSSSPAHGTLTLQADGSFIYTPSPNYHGTDSFGALVADGRGGTAVATVTVTISPVNDAPVAADASLTLDEDTTTSGNVLANASDADGDVLSAALVSGPAHGTLILNADGSFTYSPSPHYSGTDSFTFTAHDGQVASNTATALLTVTPVNDPPSLATLPNLTAEATGASGAAVTFAATGTDVEDGAMVATCSPASGTVFPLGTSTVECTVSDAGGEATSGSFTVAVVDTTAPSIAVMNDISAPATSAAGATVTYTAPATQDLVEGAGTATCAPASGSTFALGATTVTCTATDSIGNSASSTFAVTVTNNAPTISAPANQTIEATGAAGATATFSAAGTDVEDGAIPAVCSPASGTVFPLGTTTVTCTVTDQAGASASDSFTVTVVDTTAPAIAANADLSAPATGPTGAVVTYAAPATSDGVDGVGSATCLPASGATFALGTTTVTCTATDAAGNSASTSFTVTVTNNAPVCTLTPSTTSLWPVNHTLVPVTASGATDVDGGPLTYTVVSIFQDEPTNTKGDGNTGVDGRGVGTATAWIRAERLGSGGRSGKSDKSTKGAGNGRVYHITFSVTDALGLSCSATVAVGVPLDRRGRPAIDDGALYDSTIAPSIPPKSDKSGKSDKSDKSDKSRKSDRPDTSGKSNKAGQPDKRDRSHKAPGEKALRGAIT